MPQSSNHYIIAIAAALGSIPEIRRFFEQAPPSGASYVVIQPLGPDIRNGLGDVLARHSKLTVKPAENEQVIENNHVYIIPTNKVTVIQNGKLYLREIKDFNKPNYTINTFLNSLAMDKGKKAIAAILSRLGKDGADGVKAIKRAGGLVIARDPACLGFSGMPVSAIAEGMVDQILEPEQMPESIAGYMRNQGKFWSKQTAKELSFANQRNNLAHSINTTLMTRLGFLSICIDSDSQVLKIYGDTTNCLFQEKKSSNLSELLVKPLDEAFREGFWKVLELGEQVTIHSIRIPGVGSWTPISLSIIPMLAGKGEPRMFLVLFMLDKSAEIPNNNELVDQGPTMEDFFQQIPLATGQTKAELKRSLGKLKTHTRYIQSYNEALLMANHDLTLHNEALHRTNEELYHVNEELRTRISRSSL